MAGLIRRGNVYYLQYRVGGREKRVSLETDSKKVAQEKRRQFESAQARGLEHLLPTRTPISELVGAYVEYMKATKTASSVIRDSYYLREAFGPACPSLAIKNRKISEKTRKRRLRPGGDGRCKVPVLEASSFEQLTTAQIADHIAALVRTRGLAPKTANRHREVLTRLFNWAMTQRGIRIPGDRNPAAQVERYREQAPRIRHLTLKQIEKQLDALVRHPQLQAMVAVYIYAGLRREEALWLRREDVDLSVKPFGVIRVRAKDVAEASWEPKTKQNRVVPISSTLRTFLDCYTPRPTKHGWYFPSPQGERYDPDNFSSDLRRVQEKAGLVWGCLDFRHTFGSQLAMKGESLYKISTLMGNSPEICRRHYAALLPECLVETVEFPRELSENDVQPGSTPDRELSEL